MCHTIRSNMVTKNQNNEIEISYAVYMLFLWIGESIKRLFMEKEQVNSTVPLYSLQVDYHHQIDYNLSNHQFYWSCSYCTSQNQCDNPFLLFDPTLTCSICLLSKAEGRRIKKKKKKKKKKKNSKKTPKKKKKRSTRST